MKAATAKLGPKYEAPRQTGETVRRGTRNIHYNSENADSLIFLPAQLASPVGRILALHYFRDDEMEVAHA